MNLIFISVDSLRFDRVGCLTHSDTKTPNIDALGKNGVRFLNNFTVSNGSLPSHTSIFTGLYPQHHGIRENGLKVPSHLATIGSILKSNGYTTSAFVSSVLLDSIYGLNSGFDSYYNTSRFNKVHHLLSKIGYKKYNVSKALVHFNIHDGRSRDWKSVNKDVLSWLDNNGSTRFFMFIHYMDIHRDTAGGTKTIREKHRFYDDNVRLADAAIGEIIEHLKQKNLFNNTLVVLFSDHGETLSDGKGHGNSVSNDEFHTPLIMHVPGQPAADITALTRTIDIMPTALALLGLNLLSSVDGTNISLHGQLGAQECFMESYPPYGDIKAVLTNQWKYVLSDGKKEELFDRHDVAEKHNVVSTEKDEAIKLKTKLKQHFNIPFTQQELDDVTKERLRGLGYLD
ncbi:MAG TPA: sulfatase [Candidatus Nanoarchaeia archaeon]|nr:sulfatase [Candidatus Nanoarchaeia archaeon]